MDEQTVRNILREAVDLANAIAEATPTMIDNQAVGVLSRIVEDDGYWSIAWRVIDKAIGYLDVENVHLIVESDSDTSLLVGESGIDPETIIMVIQAVIEIIKWWKNR